MSLLITLIDKTELNVNDHAQIIVNAYELTPAANDPIIAVARL
jgi:hypothetical protein